MSRLSLLIPVFVVALGACSDSPAPTAAPKPGGPNQSLVATGGARTRYIVLLDSSTADVAGAATSLAASDASAPRLVWHAIKGFTADLTPAGAASLSRRPGVRMVTEDTPVQATGVQMNPPSWGLDRVDQRNLPLDGSYTFTADGTGTHVYIMDTGLWPHDDFSARMRPGVDFVGDGMGTLDCTGHGTHVASTAVGTTFGVAKNAFVHPVRVLDCSGTGTASRVISGIDWVMQNHHSPAVVNMSFAGTRNAALDQAVTNMVPGNVLPVVAAGNQNVDACTVSPADAEFALTVAASDINDHRASFSNFGGCVIIFAPGVNITGAKFQTQSGSTVRSGTSMAAAHVTGNAAKFWERHPTFTALQVEDGVAANATMNVIVGAGPLTPNRFIFTH